MKISTQCPQCQTRYSINSDLAGKRVGCKKCGGAFVAATAIDTRSPQDTQTSQPTAAGRPAVKTAGAPDKNQMPEKFGRYVVRGRLGAGAFGAVYRAFDPRLEREVALKIPRPGSLRNLADKERFVREAKSAAQLRHPHIVPVHDAEIEGNAIFITSAFIDGETLKQRLEPERLQQEPLSPQNAARIVAALAQALDYAHRQKIVHRDVKPANIMLDKQGEPLLMDFGLARLVNVPDAPGRDATGKSPGEVGSTATRVGDVMGTPAYMSPEQAAGRNQDVGPASDQYSLGVVLFEMLCGRPPFEGVVEYVLSQVKEGAVPRLRTVKPEIAPDLEAICLKALSRDPMARYENCQQFARDLEQWQRGESIIAREWQLPERVARWCRRNPLGATLSGVILAILVLIAVVSPIVAAYQANLRSIAATSAKIAQNSAEEAKRKELEAEAERKRAEEALQKAKEDEEARKQSERKTKAAEESERKANEQKLKEERKAKEEAERASIAAYGQQMTGLLSRVLEGHDIAEDLKMVPGKFRGWEWSYLSKLSAGTYRFDQRSGVSGAPPRTPNPGGNSAARFLRLAQLRPREPSGSNTPPVCAANAPGTRVAIAAKGIVPGFGSDTNRDLLIFDLTTGQPSALPQNTQLSNVQHLAFDPDGGLLAVLEGEQGYPRRVTIIDLLNPQSRMSAVGFDIRFAGSKAPQSRVCFSRDGRVIAAGGGQSVAFYNYPDRKELKPHDLRKAAAGAGSRTIWCFQLNRAGTRAYVGGQRTVGSAPNRSTTGSLWAYDIENEKVLEEWTDLGKGVIDLDLSADDSQLAAAVIDDDKPTRPLMPFMSLALPGHVAVWKLDAATQTPTQLKADGLRPRRVRFGATTRLMVVDGESSVREWDLETRQPLAPMPPLIPFILEAFPKDRDGFRYVGLREPGDVLLGTVQSNSVADASAPPNVVIGVPLESPPLALATAAGRVAVVTHSNVGVYSPATRSWLWQQPIQIPISMGAPPGGPPPAVRPLQPGESLGSVSLGFDANLNLICIGGATPPWRAVYSADAGKLLRTGGPNSFGQTRTILLGDWALQLQSHGVGSCEFDLQLLQPKSPPMPGGLTNSSKFLTAVPKSDRSALVVLREKSVDIFHKDNLNKPLQFDAGTNPASVGWSESGESVLVVGVGSPGTELEFAL